MVLSLDSGPTTLICELIFFGIIDEIYTKPPSGQMSGLLHNFHLTVSAKSVVYCVSGNNSPELYSIRASHLWIH